MLEGMWDRWGSWLQRRWREALDVVALGLALLLLRGLGIGVPIAAFPWLSFLAGAGAIAFGSEGWILHLLGARPHAKASGSIASLQNP
jgi:hypothetical protein